MLKSVTLKELFVSLSLLVVKGPIKRIERANTVAYEAPFTPKPPFLFNFILLSKLALNLFSTKESTRITIERVGEHADETAWDEA